MTSHHVLRPSVSLFLGTADSPRILKKFNLSPLGSELVPRSPFRSSVFFLILVSRAFNKAIIIIVTLLILRVCMYVCMCPNVRVITEEKGLPSSLSRLDIYYYANRIKSRMQSTFNRITKP
jgi:hypothetical protein